MNPNASERLLTAVADLQHYVRHGVDEKTCGACPRWDELQGAALAMVGEYDTLRARAAELEACVEELEGRAAQAEWAANLPAGC